MKKIYEDFFKKLDENEINFFKVQMSKVYSQKKELNESYLKRRRVISTDIILNYIYDNNWNIEKKDNSLDLFVLYLESKGLIKDYRKGDHLDFYDFFITELGVAFLEYIIQQ